MTDLRQSLDLAVERFRLEWGLPEVSVWQRSETGTIRMEWYASGTMRYGWLGQLREEATWYCGAVGQGQRDKIELSDAIAWLAAHGLDVRPEPERYGLVFSAFDDPGELQAGDTGIEWYGHGWYLRWDMIDDRWQSEVGGVLEYWDTCKDACDWIRSQLEGDE